MSGRFWLIGSLTLVAVMLIGVKFLVPYFIGKKTNMGQRTIRVGEKIIAIEIADNASSMEKGLGGRDSLAPGSGMLFIYPRAVTPRFWMKGMKFDLDFIWINENVVVETTEEVKFSKLENSEELPFYTPKQPVTMVLEVSSGFVKKNGIRVGDQVDLN